MLERTAACLEPSGLRVIPPRNKPLPSTRHLHTAFWQHGAANVELTRAWQALMHGTAHDAKTSPPSLTASTFLLDFLYPNSVVALMRPLAPINRDRPHRLRFRSRPSHVSPRLYNSSTPRQQLRQPSTDAHPSPPLNGLNNGVPEGGDVELAEFRELEPGPVPGPELEPVPLVAHDTHSHIVAIEHILKKDDSEQVDILWRHYKYLDHQSQNAYIQQIMLFLSRTGRVSDSWKISELFHRLHISCWDNDTFVTGLAAEINLQNPSQALSIFERGLRSAALDNTALVDALDLLLTAAFRSSTVQFLEELWKLYPEMAVRWNFDGIIADLKHLASVPGIAEKAVEFPSYVAQRLSNPSANETDREALGTLQKILVRKALLSCNDSQTIPLLLITKDRLAFEEYLTSVRGKARKKLSTEVYAIYRDLPDSTPSHSVLHCVFNAYTGMQVSSSPSIIAGVELLWGDWHKFHIAPSRRAYKKHLTFYAARGHKMRVYDLWVEYVERFRNDPANNVIYNDDTFAHLLQVNAVKGESDEAQRIFDDMIKKFGLRPSAYHWNILLNSYVKADDYDGAIATFDRLCAAITPDQYSYATLMQMAGSRGDLEFAVGLYRRARSSKVLANDAMLASLVDAYCLNDHMKEAQNVCTQAADRGVRSTRMWNRLLLHHAVRRDLASINNVLNVMTDKKIPYTHFTYQQLLLGLALCRQSLHALHLLTVALKENVFEVTPAHFNIVMGGLLRTGEPGPVKRLFRLMKEHGIPITDDIAFSLSQSMGRWRQLPLHQRRRHKKGEWLSGMLRTFYQIYGVDGGSSKALSSVSTRDGSSLKAPTPVSASNTQSRALLRSRPEAMRFGSMMYVFAHMNDRVRVSELVDVYRHVFRDTSKDQSLLPLPMLNAVMLSALHQKNYERAKETWQLVFESTKREARSADFRPERSNSKQISPKYRYHLSHAIRVMQEVFFKEGESVALQKLIREVLEAGFEIDSKNWNYHVQILVQLKQPKAAFEICEKVLMPNWTGWAVVRAREAVRNALPLDTRRKGLSPRYLRPTATTLYWLAKAYMELDKQSPWSSEAANTLREVNNECQKVIRAIKSMVRVHSALEREIFDSPDIAATVEGSELGDLEYEEYEEHEEHEAGTEEEERHCIEGA